MWRKLNLLMMFVAFFVLGGIVAIPVSMIISVFAEQVLTTEKIESLSKLWFALIFIELIWCAIWFPINIKTKNTKPR
jgi:hypothetical protein